MTTNLDLKDWGWDAHFAGMFAEAAPPWPDAIPARIVREDRGQYRAATGQTIEHASVTGAFRHNHQRAESYPAVGDWVVATRVDDEEKLQIHAVLNRRTAFKRTQAGTTSGVQVVAANVDAVFIVVGMDGDFSPRRAERYITLTYESGARPIIILSKSDLCDQRDTFVAQMETVAINVPIHEVSSLQGDGVEALESYLARGQTVACLGSSGAGKSTLINALLGRDAMATALVREDDSRGRHTTTHRQLLLLPNGGALIDTPGMRELQLTGDDESLTASFKDVEALAAQCRFRDCSHDNESGCAIRAAIKDGTLSRDRLKSYHKLNRELDYAQRRQSESFAYEERQHQKSLHQMYRRVLKENRKRKS